MVFYGVSSLVLVQCFYHNNLKLNFGLEVRCTEFFQARFRRVVSMFKFEEKIQNIESDSNHMSCQADPGLRWLQMEQEDPENHEDSSLQVATMLSAYICLLIWIFSTVRFFSRSRPCFLMNSVADPNPRGYEPVLPNPNPKFRSRFGSGSGSNNLISTRYLLKT
jgi:hypothetical protein